jgi:hypothetical protein
MRERKKRGHDSFDKYSPSPSPLKPLRGQLQTGMRQLFAKMKKLQGQQGNELGWSSVYVAVCPRGYFPRGCQQGSAVSNENQTLRKRGQVAILCWIRMSSETGLRRKESWLRTYQV